MTALHFGTMGFSYPDWADVFYPPGAKPGEYLAHYARHFGTVELDTTFHATPPVDRVRRWADVTPDRFRFCAKLPKAVTHEGAIDRRIREAHQFVDVMRTFGEKLAVLLVQLPPSFGADQFESMEVFLRAMPRDVRFAVEFRNSSWGQPRTLDLLRTNGCALVTAEYLTKPRQIHATADFLYLRWIGEHERFKELNHEQIEVGPNLEWWREELRRVTGSDNPDHRHPERSEGSRDRESPVGRPALAVRDVWGFFNNDYSGYSVATCRRFMRMMGLPIPQVDPMDEGRLFA